MTKFVWMVCMFCSSIFCVFLNNNLYYLLPHKILCTYVSHLNTNPTSDNIGCSFFPCAAKAPVTTFSHRIISFIHHWCSCIISMRSCTCTIIEKRPWDTDVMQQIMGVLQLLQFVKALLSSLKCIAVPPRYPLQCWKSRGIAVTSFQHWMWE